MAGSYPIASALSDRDIFHPTGKTRRDTYPTSRPVAYSHFRALRYRVDRLLHRPNAGDDRPSLFPAEHSGTLGGGDRFTNDPLARGNRLDSAYRRTVGRAFSSWHIGRNWYGTLFTGITPARFPAIRTDQW